MRVQAPTQIRKGSKHWGEEEGGAEGEGEEDNTMRVNASMLFFKTSEIEENNRVYSEHITC